MSINFIFLFIVIASGLFIAISFSFYSHKKEIKKLNKAKINLEENALIKFNHSYRLVNKKDKSIRYIRVFSILLDKEVKAKCFCTTKDGEIGIWCDNIEFLYNIKDNYKLEDCGKWN